MKRQQQSQKAENKGFSLIEVAVVLIILSLVITPIFALLNKQRKQDDIKEDVAKFDRSLGALALFVKENGYYPCPADPNLAQGTAGFGEEKCTLPKVNGNIGGTPVPSKKVIIGVLPVKTLNLSYRDAVNTNNWKYIYAVTEDLTTAPTYDGQGAIHVVDEADNDFLGKAAHFVIVDPGLDGKGTRNILGGANDIHDFGACPATGTRPLDSENCDNDAVFRDADFALKFPATHHTYYDDSVVYTLTRSESTMWMVRENVSDTSASLDIVNRNIGNVGIGTDRPSHKLHVTGGDVRIQAEDRGGTIMGGALRVETNVFASSTIKADKNIEAVELISSGNNIEIGNEVKSREVKVDDIILSSGNVVADNLVHSNKDIEADETISAGTNVIAGENVEAGNDLTATESITSPVFYYE